jgi:hypothetical protein
MEADVVDYNWSDHEKSKILIQKIRAFKPVTFTCFLDRENFIFTKYSMTNHGATCILENADGDEFRVENCNCGYGGTGPHNTVDLVCHLGFETEYAEALIFNHASLRFKLDDQVRVIPNSIETDCLFENRSQDLKLGQILLNDEVRVNLPNREIYFTATTFKFRELLLLLDKLGSIKSDIETVEYYIGKDNWKIRKFDIPIDGGASNEVARILSGSYIRISTSYTDVTCFLHKEEAISAMNVVHRLLTEKQLFHDSLYSICCIKDDNLDDQPIEKVKRALLAWMAWGRAREFYRSFTLSNEWGGMYHAKNSHM